MSELRPHPHLYCPSPELFSSNWFLSGSSVQEEELVSSENSASIFNTLSDLPSQLEDGAVVLGEAVRLAGSLSQDTLDTQRHKHLAYILAEQTQLNSNTSHTLNTSLNKASTHTHTHNLKTTIVFMKSFHMTCTLFSS